MASVDWNAQITQYLKIGAVPDASLGPLLEGLGNACQSAVEHFIGRTFDTKSYTETYDGNNRRTLFLRHDPVVSITSVSVYGSPSLSITVPVAPTYAASVAMIEPGGQGILLTDGSGFSAGIQNVMVSYTAGLTDPESGAPPADLVFAVAYWASLLFKNRDRVGENSRTVGDQLSTFTTALPKDIQQLVARYQRFVIFP